MKELKMFKKNSKNFIIACLMIFGSVFLYGKIRHVRGQLQKQKKGIIILLNGTSASGKSTLAKKITELWKKPMVITGLDALFCYVAFPQYFSPHVSDEIKNSVMEGFWKEDIEGNKMFELQWGEEGKKMIHAMHDAMIAYANNGVDSVADYIAYDNSWIPELEKKCKENNISLYCIKVHASLETIETREIARGTSPVGHARSHYNTVHDKVNYFFEIDNENDSLENNAQKIVEIVKKNIAEN